jgi:hypothetical protein
VAEKVRGAFSTVLSIVVEKDGVKSSSGSAESEFALQSEFAADSSDSERHSGSGKKIFVGDWVPFSDEDDIF